MKKSIYLLLLFFFNIIFTEAGISKLPENGTIKGKVIEEISRAPVPFANIIVEGTTTGATTDTAGYFEIKNVTPGYVRLVVSSIGYKIKTTEEIFVTKEKIPFVEIVMTISAASLSEIEVSGPKFVKKDESPLSLQTIGIREIERNPGGNRDISKIIQSLPGVASTPSFRNDIIIRGGAPSENKFYLDGVEVPVINHFQTQGSSGGPVGIINVNFIREVDFYSGAFPASRGNALSSVLEFKQIEGNQEKMGFRGTIGSSEIGLTLDGPLGKNTNYIFSVRRSYLQFLFSLFKLPFLPTFTDAQFKVKHKFDDKNEITLIGLGGYDIFELNEKVNEDISDPEQLELNNYILGNLPVNNQWNYTTGAVYKHFGKNSVTSLIFSRNELKNESEKYIDNDDSSPDNLRLDYDSKETENKFRVEKSFVKGTIKFNAGLSTELAAYTSNGFDTRPTPAGAIKFSFNSELSLLKYGAFISVSKPVLKNRLLLSAGLRSDASNYSNEMNNPLKQLSPRFSASYSLTEKWSLNFNTGRYYQMPAYTILGYSDANGTLINKKNKVTYIYADHLVGGIQFNPDNSTKITVESFYKKYGNYPFSLNDSISLANLGSDFGVVGNESVNSSSEGRAAGIEFLVQRRSNSGIYGILAYTFVRSEFTGPSEKYISSAWDNRNILTLTAGKKMRKNWDLGIKWRYVGGRPFTPYDTLASALKTNWDAKGVGILDYSILNSERSPAFHQLDIRIDKTWFREKWSLNLYLDIQNLYNFKSKNPDILNVRTDTNGVPLTDPDNPDYYQVYFINDESGTILPTIGLILDF
ncbi:MAG: TonB-dependent receptor [Bacteroidota bacterium]|nr:TonB-dependent receptor [Bacteroidota bacterium]